MKPGPRPKPANLRLITGNASKRPISFDEFRPATSKPKPPRHLKGEALKEYRRLVDELAKYGMVSEVDRGALSMVATTWARYVEAEEMIARAEKAAPGAGLFVKTPNGFPVQSPWVAVSNKAMEQYRQFLGEFGLSPATRGKVTPGNPLQPDLFPVDDDAPKGGFGSI